MGNITVQKFGRKRFGPLIDITDPCYNRDVWCRMNNVPVKPGKYECMIRLSDEGEWGIRVSTIGIYRWGRIPKKHDMEELGEIGVDAGLAGFFNHKPDYTDSEWAELCDSLKRLEHAWVREEGFFSSSGYGDGGYPVYAYRNRNHEITALEIRFLED